MIRQQKFVQSVFFIIFVICTTVTAPAFGADVTLRWDPNDPVPEGYRVFAREDGQSYNYDHPLWENSQTTCTLTGLVDGVSYHFVVRAFDGQLESADSAEVAFTPPVVVPNQVPVANAGQNQTVYEGASVTLDGSGSVDADGTIAGYAWAQNGGTDVSLAHATEAQAGFTAPVVDMDGETLTFRLTVTDDDGSSSAASVSVLVLKSSSTDVDGDNVPDVLDLFPNDPAEWADNDSDGIGDNQDPDDDNDGMTDVWETAYGLDPLKDDAALDADGDGVSNIDEFHADSDPTTAPSNIAPDAPVVDAAVQTERVSLTPVLMVTAPYVDSDNDEHFKSQWQISTDTDFATLILDKTSKNQLTAYDVGKMVLDIDTVYHWRVRFIDSRQAVSDWSETATFTTIAAENSSDTDVNGIPDSQEVDPSVDVNENGVADNLETTIMSVNTVVGQSVIGVETTSDNVTLVSIESLPTDAAPDSSVEMGFGLVGFKLYLLKGVSTATVNIHFSKPVSKGAQLYKYYPDTGWQLYENAVFAPNRKSVAVMLVDGGPGDEDGTVNGVIVDPTGIATDPETVDNSSAAISTSGTSSSAGGGGGGCFISAANNDPLQSALAGDQVSKMLTALILLNVGIGVMAVRRER